MSQNLVSNLTLRIEQEKQVMQEHQEKIGLFQKNTKSLLNSSKKDLQSLQEDVQNTTKDATNLLNEAKQSLNSAQTASQSLAELLQQQTKETANLLSQQAQQLKQLKAQSDQLNSMSHGIAETAKLKKALFTSNMVLASIALILIISSIALAYVSKSKYNDIQAMQNKVDYLKSRGGSMFTMECGETVRRVRPERERELRTGQWDETAWNSKGGALNESRSAVITDYRRTSTAAQRATEAARASLTAYSDSESNHRRIGEIQQRTGEALQSIERAKQRADQYHQAITESEVVSRFIEKFGEQLKTAIREPFKAVSNRLEHRESSRDDNREHLAEFGTSRDRNQIEATDRTSDRENEFSRAISTKSSGFNPTSIFEALDQLDQRRELQRAKEQTKKNDRGYDSPSPF